MNTIIPHNTIQSTVEWFARARPDSTSKDFHVQTGVHFEEVGEMLEQLDSHDETTHTLIVKAEQAIKALGEHLKASDNVLRIKDHVLFLDSLCDQVVTGTGVALTQNYRFIDALGEVNGSNWSKFEDGHPVFNEHRKVMKGKDYYKADLKRFV